MQSILQPWPWYVAGPLIGATLSILLFSGKTFGMSSNMRTLCAMCGAQSKSKFFDIDWRSQRWNLVVVLGAAVGGAIAVIFLNGDSPVAINPTVAAELQSYGLASAGKAYLPAELFGSQAWSNPLALVVLALGGFLVGFGARWAAGCTSGHAITGLSNLQLPSLIAVVGFFIGGLVATYFILPYLLPGDAVAWLVEAAPTTVK